MVNCIKQTSTYSFVDLLVTQTQMRMLTIAMIRTTTTVASATGRTTNRISCCGRRMASDEVGGQLPGPGVLGTGDGNSAAVVTGACEGTVPSAGWYII